MLGLLIEEDLADVDRQQVLIALFQSDLHGFTQPLAKALTLTAQLRYVQEHGVCVGPSFIEYTVSFPLKIFHFSVLLLINWLYEIKFMRITLGSYS